MFKRFLTLLFILGCIPVSAGELENALSQNKNIFLYFFTPECGSCSMFTPRYNKLSKMYDKHYTFIKLNASTQYGNSVFRKFRGRYVPYVVLINSKNKVAQIDPSCLMNTECSERELMKFIK